MEGMVFPVWPNAVKLSVQTPAVVVTYPDIVSKSRRSWQTSEETLEMVKTQVPVELGVYVLGYPGFLM